MSQMLKMIKKADDLDMTDKDTVIDLLEYAEQALAIFCKR